MAVRLFNLPPRGLRVLITTIRKKGLSLIQFQPLKKLQSQVERILVQTSSLRFFTTW